MTIVDDARRQQIAQHVQGVLDRRQPRQYRVSVDPDGIVQDDEWYHVVVKSGNNVRDSAFYQVLAETEAELNEQNDGHQYLLVPAIVDG